MNNDYISKFKFEDDVNDEKEKIRYWNLHSSLTEVNYFQWLIEFGYEENNNSEEYAKKELEHYKKPLLSIQNIIFDLYKGKYVIKPFFKYEFYHCDGECLLILKIENTIRHDFFFCEVDVCKHDDVDKREIENIKKLIEYKEKLDKYMI